ncbi:unnamed protein product [Cyclocybe aegerita]|uniref:NAD(P)-binding protein n=1 Tax=Cyclocybe aegerita TaxID=1973307 RepID=A0A8S0XDN0_CYCAE|nr:unnamed protein product [Cyclocybe aegerita]
MSGRSRTLSTPRWIHEHCEDDIATFSSVILKVGAGPPGAVRVSLPNQFLHQSPSSPNVTDMSLLVLSASDVDALVSEFTPLDLQLLMARVFAQFSRPRAGEEAEGKAGRGICMPPRLSVPMPKHTVLFMPARLGAVPGQSVDPQANFQGTAVKVVSVPKSGDPRGLPGTTLVLDEATGAAKAVVNARKLTALRNAAGSLLSTSIVGPSNPQTLVTLGAGKQIEAHINLHLRRFPSINRCTIVNRTLNERASSLKDAVSTQFPSVTFRLLASDPISDSTIHTTKEIEQAIRSADLIVCATSSTKALFPSSWVRDGTHIILIGSYTSAMREVDDALIRRSLKPNSSRSTNLIVDSGEACLHEAGELIAAGLHPSQMVEIGELVPTDDEGNVDIQAYSSLIEKKRPRQDGGGFDGPVTIFKSVGVGIQDVAIASAIVNKALSFSGGRIGTQIASYDG